MSKKPAISIIIPVYNQASKIINCLDSIFAQTFKDFEVIVVNDGSTDNLLAALRPWQTKIKVFHQKNQGASAARNFGFNQSRGELVIFFDADIIARPEMLEKMKEVLLKNKDAAYVYSSFKFGWKKFNLWPFDKQKLRQTPYIHTTSLIRREAFPGFDPSLKKFQDWDLWLTILSQGRRGVWLDQVLFQVRSGGTMSRWRPRFFYRFSWLKVARQYQIAKEIIREKHKL